MPASSNVLFKRHREVFGHAAWPYAKFPSTRTPSCQSSSDAFVTILWFFGRLWFLSHSSKKVATRIFKDSPRPLSRSPHRAGTARWLRGRVCISQTMCTKPYKSAETAPARILWRLSSGLHTSSPYIWPRPRLRGWAYEHRRTDMEATKRALLCLSLIHI